MFRDIATKKLQATQVRSLARNSKFRSKNNFDDGDNTLDYLNPVERGGPRADILARVAELSMHQGLFAWRG